MRTSLNPIFGGEPVRLYITDANIAYDQGKPLTRRQQ